MNNRSLAAAIAFNDTLKTMGATLLEKEWLGCLTPHRCVCSNGHECYPKPTRIQQGEGVCKICSYGSHISEANFKKRLIELRATLIETKWKGARTPHHVRCVYGHDCYPRPDSLQRGQGICQICAGNDSETAEKIFRATLIKFGAKLLEQWKGAQTPHHVQCAYGHDCYPQPRSIQRGQGICRICAHKIWDVFYVVSCKSRQEVKLGITSGDPQPRLSDHYNHGFIEVVRLLTDLAGNIAPELERKIMHTLRDIGMLPLYGREYYHLDALPHILNIVDSQTRQIER